ncbi:MAG TPA: inositol monophosphatase family protein, partial [Bryobacteraceae bacterium]
VRASTQAVELALRYQPGIVAETKADESPVTVADRECEKLIARILIDAFPDDGMLGEEGTNVESRNGRRWIVDPIDGTRDYLRGNPLWANLIGLEAGNEIVAGLVNLPLLGNLYTARRHAGAFRNNSPVHISSRSSVDQSALCFNAFNKLNGTPFKDRMLDWMARFWSVRGLGGASDAMMVASGQADIWIEPSAAAWDLAPLKIIIEEAGGVFLNFDGGSGIYAGNCIACTPGLREEAVRLLNGF